MTGGIIQLVAYGQENMFITKDPQITFFKIVYKRHTNFSCMQMPQFFTNQHSTGTNVNFNKKISTNITKSADLMGKTHIIITLPKIKKFQDSITKFAWVKRIGFTIIKSVEIEIGGRTIDKHYGEWISLWNEITGNLTSEIGRGINAMIGNVPELTDFTDSKEEYTLYIPLNFWFCRSSELALPLVALQYSEIRMNIEFNDVEKCYLISPTHYINCEANLVNFLPNEYIEQTVDGVKMEGLFNHYDIINKRLYYYKISTNKFIGIPVTGKNLNDPSVVQSLLDSSSNQKYLIYGHTSEFKVYPDFNQTSKTYAYTKIRNLNMVDCHLLIDYYFLDIDERQRFLQSKHDYLIEQLYYTPSSTATIDNINRTFNLTLDQPCKLLVWIAQMNYIAESKDYYNYTDSCIRKYNDTKYPDQQIGQTVGNNIIDSETILLNGLERLSYRDSEYFTNVQSYQYLKYGIQTGINIYSFGLFPLMVQPTGTCNMSQINTIDIKLAVTPNVTSTTPANFRLYGLCYNIFRITAGIGALVFVK